jgi:hypothetical protein
VTASGRRRKTTRKAWLYYKSMLYYNCSNT